MKKKKEKSGYSGPLSFFGEYMKLDKKTHTYIDTDKNKYFSVSHVLDSLETPFDPDGLIAVKVAAREGCSVAEIQARWAKIGQDSMTRGTEIHSALQKYIETGKKSTKWKDVIESFQKIKFQGTLKSEQILHNKNYKLAGTTDLIEEAKNYHNIYDFKTSKNIDFFNAYNQQMMLPPVEHMPQCNYSRYSLQLSFYAWMLEQEGKKIGKLGIIWITQSLKMYVYPCNYLKYEVEKILEKYDTK